MTSQNHTGDILIPITTSQNCRIDNFNIFQWYLMLKLPATVVLIEIPPGAINSSSNSAVQVPTPLMRMTAV